LALHNGVLQRALLRPVLVCVPGGLRAAGDFFLPDRAPPRPPPMPLQPRIAHSGGGRLGGGGGKERRGAEEPVSPPAYFPYPPSINLMLSSWFCSVWLFVAPSINLMLVLLVLGWGCYFRMMGYGGWVGGIWCIGVVWYG